MLQGELDMPTNRNLLLAHNGETHPQLFSKLGRLFVQVGSHDGADLWIQRARDFDYPPGLESVRQRHVIRRAH